MFEPQDTLPMLSWRDAGTGDAILFIHAFPLDSSMWAAQLQGIPAGWRAIAPDLPGFGASEPGSGVLSIDTYADSLARLLMAQSIPHAVVCGVSMGGYVAFALQRRHPDLVRGLILCDTRAESDEKEVRVTRLELARRVRLEGMQPVEDALLSKLVCRTTRLQNPARMDEIARTIRNTSPTAAAAALAAMAHRKDTTGTLREIDIPTLIVVGSEDPITPPGTAQMLARSIRGARIEVIEGAAHLPNLEQPDAFNAVLRGFLATMPPAPTAMHSSQLTL